MACGLSAVNIKGLVLKKMAKNGEVVHYHLCCKCIHHASTTCFEKCLKSGTTCLYIPRVEGEQNNDKATAGTTTD